MKRLWVVGFLAFGLSYLGFISQPLWSTENDRDCDDCLAFVSDEEWMNETSSKTTFCDEKKKEEKNKKIKVKKDKKTKKDKKKNKENKILENQDLERIPDELKCKFAKEFSKNIHFLKQIILEAETPEETQNFIQTFSKQNEWFDKTLTETQYFNDASYLQIIKKKADINKIVIAQQKADAMLKAVARNLTLGEQEFQRLRLLTLYDINSLIQQKQALIYKLFPITDQELKEVIIKVVKEVAGTQYSQIEETLKNALGERPAQIPTMDKHIELLKKKLADEQEKFSQKREKFKDILQEKTKENLSLELQIKKSEAETKTLIEQEKNKAIKTTKKALRPQIEETKKQKLELETTVKANQDKISSLSRKLEQTETKLEESNKNIKNLEKKTVQQQESEAKQRILDELLDRQQADYQKTITKPSPHVLLDVIRTNWAIASELWAINESFA